MMVLGDIQELWNYSSAEENRRAFRDLVSDIRQLVPLEGRLHHGLYRLAEYDHVNRSDYLHTLKVYLEHNCNAQKCSRLLFLHRNSLVYRIRRIQEIGGFDLSDPEELAYLRLSFLLDKSLSFGDSASV